jgi:hypothetical protein
VSSARITVTPGAGVAPTVYVEPVGGAQTIGDVERTASVPARSASPGRIQPRSIATDDAGVAVRLTTSAGGRPSKPTSEYSCGPSGTRNPITRAVHTPASGAITRTCSTLSRRFFPSVAGVSGLAGFSTNGKRVPDVGPTSSRSRSFTSVVSASSAATGSSHAIVTVSFPALAGTKKFQVSTPRSSTASSTVVAVCSSFTLLDKLIAPSPKR